MKVLSAAGAKYFLNKLKAIFAPNSNFVKSGSEAKAGLVPSPGTTAGTTKYLREDGTWQVPPDNNTTYSNMAAATASAAGKAGLRNTCGKMEHGRFRRIITLRTATWLLRPQAQQAKQDWYLRLLLVNRHHSFVGTERGRFRQIQLIAILLDQDLMRKMV